MEDEEEAHSKYALMNPKTQKELDNMVKLHFIQLKLSHKCNNSRNLRDLMDFF